MVDFGKTDYFNAMDPPKKIIPVKELSHKEIGISSKMGDVLQGLKSDIIAGASHVEIGFMGQGKGSLGQGNTTPEMFDKRKREEVRQLGKINGVSLSTHASVRMSGWSGFNPQAPGGGGFSEKQANENLMELKRTIDFAADTAEGGAIVIHTGEFPRNVKDKRFNVEPEEESNVYFADPITGKIEATPKGELLQIPKWKRDKNGNYLNINDEIIKDPTDTLSRMPEKDEEGRLIFRKMSYKDFKNEINEWNNKKPDQQRDVDREWYAMFRSDRWEVSYSMGAQYWEAMKRHQESVKELTKEQEYWKHFESKAVGEEGMESIRRAFNDKHQSKLKKGEKPSDFYTKHLENTKKEIIRDKEGYLGYEKELQKARALMDRLETIEDVGLKRSAKTIAKAAMYALAVEKEKKLEKSLFIAPENMFAEMGYGSHPDELRKIVVKSRSAMVDELKKKGMNVKEAKKVAKDHIKATWDIGHGNTWAKYFEENPDLSPTENKKVFDKWMIKELTKLTDEGIIGHVHVSDNFGYEDEHLSPGMGNAPINEFVKMLKNKKYEGNIIVEWGAQGQDEPYGAMLAAWANVAGSSMYRVEGVGLNPTWSDLEGGGYFSGGSTPRMLFGPYATAMSKDFQLWSYSDAPIE
ncbi:MAG: sugar phosphate isomerase/epimerase [Nanoarchaeota archaeon]|nr:sugar phosphate isomerase/epimerase [Nanoarchaeota archaeon]